jgi:putative hemolysin
VPASPEGPGTTILVIVVAALIGAVMSALTAVLNALPEEFLMAVRDEGGPDGVIATRVLVDRIRIRARFLAGRVLSLVTLAASTAQLLIDLTGAWMVIATIGAGGLGYALLAEVAQTIARNRARVHGLRMLRWARGLELLFAPFGVPIQWVSKATEKLFPTAEQPLTSEVATCEVEHIIERREEVGAISEENAKLLLRVLEFNTTVAHEVMVPRTQMIAIDLGTSAEEVVARAVEEGHSRYPVYRERVDRIEGILYAKDLFRVKRESSSGALDISSIVRRPVLFVAESQKIGHVLREMQSKRQHIAVVVDEFGGTAGIVTLEDILEEIVGEIHDEHDEEEALVTEVSPGTYLADARVSIHDLGQMLDAPLESGEQTEADSLGGLVVGLAGKVPDVGEQLTLEQYELIVREADEKHVKSVEIRRRTPEPPKPAEPAEGAA